MLSFGVQIEYYFFQRFIGIDEDSKLKFEIFNQIILVQVLTNEFQEQMRSISPVIPRSNLLQNLRNHPLDALKD